MNTVIIKDLAVALSKWKIIIVIYFIQFLIALFFGVQIYDLIKSELGSSLELNKLASQFDYTVFSDFLHSASKSLGTLFNQLTYLILIWLAVSIFLSTGQIYCLLQKGKFSIIEFWNVAACHFFSYS